MKRRLRIALLYLGRRGGISNHTLELARGLQGRCDIECYFSEYCSLRKEMEALKCPVHFFPTYHGWPSYVYSSMLGDSVPRIRRAIEKQSPDFVVDTGAGPWGETLYRKRKHRQAKWARMIHDVVFHEGSKLSWRVHRFLFPFGADVILAASDFCGKQLREIYPHQQIIVSRVGVHFGGGTPDLDRIAANRRNFLFFGRIEKYKGIDVLVDAFGIARSINPELRLVIAGKGDIAPEVKAKAESIGVTLLNHFIPDEQIDNLVAEAGVLVLPYISATQSGISATGLAKGLPMIATNVGGLPEHVIDGHNGLLVPPKDPEKLAAAMVKIAESESAARRMSQASFDLGKTRFEWNGIAEDLLDDLEAVARPTQSSRTNVNWTR